MSNSDMEKYDEVFRAAKERYTNQSLEARLALMFWAGVECGSQVRHEAIMARLAASDDGEFSLPMTDS